MTLTACVTEKCSSTGIGEAPPEEGDEDLGVDVLDVELTEDNLDAANFSSLAEASA